MELLEFFRKAMELKETKRSGWVLQGVEDPESVADHSFMLGLVSYVMAKRFGLDADKCMKMGMIHDLCEAYSGDIPNSIHDDERGMTRDEKERREREGMERVLSLLPEEISDEFRSLWEEFEGRKSDEAKLVKGLDKLEMCLQALDYAKKGNRGLLRFMEDGKRNIRMPEVKKIFLKIYREFKRGERE